MRPWVRITFLGWLLGIVLVIALALTRESTLRGLPGALLYLGIVGAGGVILGLATSLPLRPLAAEVAGAEKR